MECLDWEIDTGACCDAPDPLVVDGVITVVSQRMRILSGHRIGLCETVVRPRGVCPPGCRKAVCCGVPDRVRVATTDGPVTTVTGVEIGGVPVVGWRYDRPWLYLTPDATLNGDPLRAWPTRDARWANCGDPETFCVTALTGVAPTALDLNIASTLACELLKSHMGLTCRIPRNTTTVTAQGVTINLRTVELRALLPEVAGWIDLVNPAGATAPATISFPGQTVGGGCGCNP